MCKRKFKDSSMWSLEREGGSGVGAAEEGPNGQERQEGPRVSWGPGQRFRKEGVGGRGMPQRREAGCSRAPAAPGHVIGHRRSEALARTPRDRGRLPKSGNTVCTQGAPDRCRRGPILGYSRPSGSRSHCPPPALLHSGASHQLGLGAVQSEPWPACRAERKYLRMYWKPSFDSGNLSQNT